MTTTDTEPYTAKTWRRYIPAYSLSEWSLRRRLDEGWKLSPCARLQRRRASVRLRSYPRHCRMAAAATLAAHAMTEAIHKANQHNDSKREAVDENRKSYRQQ